MTMMIIAGEKAKFGQHNKAMTTYNHSSSISNVSFGNFNWLMEVWSTGKNHRRELHKVNLLTVALPSETSIPS